MAFDAPGCLASFSSRGLLYVAPLLDAIHTRGVPADDMRARARDPPRLCWEPFALGRANPCQETPRRRHQDKDVAKRPKADLDTLERLYIDAYERLLHVAYAIIGDLDAAADAVQDGFAAAVAHQATYRGDGSLEGWVWKIVVNAARSRARTDRRLRTRPTSREADDDASDVSALSAVVARLPERQRLAVFLRYFAGFSYAEIADVMEVAPGTVATTLSRAHSALRRSLEEVRQ